MLQRLLARGGSFASPLWKASQIDAPDVNALPLSPKAPEVFKDQNGNVVPPPAHMPGQAPPQPAAVPTQPMPPVQGLDLPWMPPMPRARPQEAPVEPSAAAGIPMPQPRPEGAPQDTGFFMRNALMQQDPMGGGFIDPTGAASVTGPDLISKMMGYLHKKV
jgi:hypothetical protein